MGKHVALTTDRTILSWLTPERRRAIYSAVAAVLAALAAVGVITGEQATAWGQVAEQALAVAALVLAAVHTGGVYEALSSAPWMTATPPPAAWGSDLSWRGRRCWCRGRCGGRSRRRG
ncbi:hypothetical protein CWT12_06400 [Actinomyces sp. 432]|uniref:phage holin n=1 Tax=Actinomyces sp. 432 TaxID=2057798 RepID=UPI001373B3CB|nr:hypothetical protein [Actinomyces sp. 432]QHO91019.1 hypothetical protein CWT12_06400 [Actinomyces sp. 432]